jgi:hypothetical protein
VATKKVNIDIVAKDKTRQAMQSATKGVDNLKNSVFNLKNALIGLGVGVAIKSFVDVGKSVEGLQVRLKFLFGSAKEGAKAFDTMAKFASKVPFSLDQIQQGAGNLAVVSKDADQLSKMLEITGNVASVTGLDFRTTAEQIQRSFSAGVASADIFRERGVRDLLGFKAGATVTAKETAEAFERVFGKGGRFGQATDEFAKTFTGTLSMVGDKIFLFKKVVAESFMVALKKEFGALDQALADNQFTIQKIARAVGKGLATAVTMVSKGVKFLNENFDMLKRLGISFVILGASKAFMTLSFAIGKATLGLLALRKASMKNIVGVLGALGIIALEASNKLEKLFQIFEKPKTIDDFSEEVKVLTQQFASLEDKTSKAFQSTKKEAEITMKGMTTLLTKMQSDSNATVQEVGMLALMIRQLSDAMNSLNDNIGEVGVSASANFTLLGDAVSGFGEGIKNAMNDGKTVFEQMEVVGEQTFGKLKGLLADFVMTGKANFGDLSRFVIKAFLEMLIGKAVQTAIAKSSAMFKMQAIKDAMISLYKGAMKTFESIPFPFNIPAVAGAIAFGMGMVNKIKGFEKGGRPPVGRPSIVGEKGAELFVPDQAGTIVPNDKLGMGKAVTVNFNISTVDARGFDELIVNSRGTIINMINSAVNEKGRMAII